MASHDITGLVTEIISLGGTEAQVLAAGPRVVQFGERWEAQNRISEAGVVALRDQLKAAAAKRQAAREITGKIAAGAVLYTRTQDGSWLVWGRAEILVVGATVTATRRDGSETQVSITAAGPVRERDGLRYRTASFRAVPDATSVRLDDGSAAAEALRIGRSYGVNGQIWDNA